MKFLLYDELYEKLSSIVSPSLEQKKKLTNDISNLDEIHYEYVYCLIFHYFSIHPKGKSEKKEDEVPFDGKILNQTQKKGLQFFIDSIPEELQKILTLYISTFS